MYLDKNKNCIKIEIHTRARACTHARTHARVRVKRTNTFFN